jgi:hypothetical protein
MTVGDGGALLVPQGTGGASAVGRTLAAPPWPNAAQRAAARAAAEAARRAAEEAELAAAELAAVAPLTARPRVEDDEALLGLTRRSNSRWGQRLFTLFFAFVFAVIVLQLVVVLLDG